MSHHLHSHLRCHIRRRLNVPSSELKASALHASKHVSVRTVEHVCKRLILNPLAVHDVESGSSNHLQNNVSMNIALSFDKMLRRQRAMQSNSAYVDCLSRGRGAQNVYCGESSCHLSSKGVPHLRTRRSKHCSRKTEVVSLNFVAVARTRSPSKAPAPPR